MARKTHATNAVFIFDRTATVDCFLYLFIVWDCSLTVVRLITLYIILQHSQDRRVCFSSGFLIISRNQHGFEKARKACLECFRFTPEGQDGNKRESRLTQLPCLCRTWSRSLPGHKGRLEVTKLLFNSPFFHPFSLKNIMWKFPPVGFSRSDYKTECGSGVM